MRRELTSLADLHEVSHAQVAFVLLLFIQFLTVNEYSLGIFPENCQVVEKYIRIVGSLGR